MSDNPMQSAHNAPRCNAKSKRTGQRCRAPAVRGYRVCRMHGARGGAPEGERNGNFKHGARTKQAIADSRFVNELARLPRKQAR
jgi:glucans biosynthesis protein